MESWLPIPGFESLYSISDLGRVYSHRKKRIMSPSISNSGGYPMYILYASGKKYPKYAHRLVLEAFSGPCPGGSEGRHLDRDPGNPALRNANGTVRLKWGSSSENKFDEVNHGTHYEASRTHCDNGHEWTERNTRIELYPDRTFKARRCRECARLRSAELRILRETDDRRCKEEDCDKPYFGRGWCSRHYAQWYARQPGNRERNAYKQRSYQARVRKNSMPTGSSQLV